MPNHNQADSVRTLVFDALSGDELIALCNDYFPEVYTRTQGSPHAARVQELLDYCRRRGTTNQLLALLKERNPFQYGRYEQRIGPAHVPARRRSSKSTAQPVIVAHAPGDETLAETVAAPIRAAGYAVVYTGPLLGGDLLADGAAPVLHAGGPLVLCATLRSVGRRWARLAVGAARKAGKCRLFTVLLEEELDVETLESDEIVDASALGAAAWGDELVAALAKYYAPMTDDSGRAERRDIERRYREMALDTFDIVDLANMPEGDRHLATRKLELRRLYVPLRVGFEIVPEELPDHDLFQAIEKRRTEQRGHADGDDGEPSRRVSVGERFNEARRLVVLGDPGAGKSTLLRWLATAYLLRLQQHSDLKELPDIATLPEDELLPILVRCRDLSAEHLRGSLDGILNHTLRKAELSEKETRALREVLVRRLNDGTALLLIDGLDEISEPGVRSRFCGQIEQISRRYEKAHIVVTSRIVGYREMGRRIGRSFEHLTVAELDKADKDDFVRRWSAVTEPAERRERIAEDLIRDIHSADRIERLTGNPMLLTTLALVKRKVGKLPSRRADLYWEAVQVLLNWRAEVDQPLDQHEAVPQLEYLAYAMCDRGVQQLRADEVLTLFEQFRAAYPNVHDAHNHTPEEFLRLLEGRTGILVAAGEVRHKGRRVVVYEFRHLTFQEYLAGLALVDGIFPGYERQRSLAEHIAPLAGRIAEERGEAAVVENWREALRLCATICNPSDVDAVLGAMLTPRAGEDQSVTGRPRAVLAALALADEPAVSVTSARLIVAALAQHVTEEDGNGFVVTGLDRAALEITRSRWAPLLREALVGEYRGRRSEARTYIGGVIAMVIVEYAQQSARAADTWFGDLASLLAGNADGAIIEAALGIMQLAWANNNPRLFSDQSGVLQLSARVTPQVVALHTKTMIALLSHSAPVSHAVAWALSWLCRGDAQSPEKLRWLPDADLDAVVQYLTRSDADAEAARFLSWTLLQLQRPEHVPALLECLHSQNSDVRQAAMKALGQIGDERAVDALVAQLDDPVVELRRAAVTTLGQIGGARAVDALLAHIDDADVEFRRVVVASLARTYADTADARLLSRDLDALSPGLDPREPITDARVRRAARSLALHTEEVRRRYETLAEKIRLRLEWSVAGEPNGSRPAQEP